MKTINYDFLSVKYYLSVLSKQEKITIHFVTGALYNGTVLQGSPYMIDLA